jgi:hypothetical protein
MTDTTPDAAKEAMPVGATASTSGSPERPQHPKLDAAVRVVTAPGRDIVDGARSVLELPADAAYLVEEMVRDHGASAHVARFAALTIVGLDAVDIMGGIAAVSPIGAGMSAANQIYSELHQAKMVPGAAGPSMNIEDLKTAMRSFGAPANPSMAKPDVSHEQLPPKTTPSADAAVPDAAVTR